MKPTFIATLLAVTISSAILFSCSSQQQDTIETPEEAVQQEAMEISHELNKIVRSERLGVFRGVFLGTSKAEVKLLEDSLEIVSEEAHQILYTKSYDMNRIVDIQYDFNDSDKVIKVQADIYPGSIEEQENSFKELGKYYTFILGKPNTENSEILEWSIQEDDYQLIIKKTGNKKIHDIQLVLNHLPNKPIL
jgi:hypothetical protein